MGETMSTASRAASIFWPIPVSSRFHKTYPKMSADTMTLVGARAWCAAFRKPVTASVRVVWFDGWEKTTPFCVRATDVIELNLVETEVRSGLGNSDIIIPDLFSERIDPAQPFPIPKYSAPPFDGPLGPGCGQGVILEDHDAGNEIEALFLQARNEGRHILDEDGLLGPDFFSQGNVDLEGNKAAVPFHVDHQGVHVVQA